MNDDLHFPDLEPSQHKERLRDPNRLTALADSGMMDSLPEEAFDRVVRLATQLMGAPVALFSLVDAQRQFFKAKAGIDESICQTGLGSSFCQYVVSSDRPLAVDDARGHPLLHSNGAVRDLNVVAYLGVPIHMPGGEVIGSLCAIDQKPQAWTDSQLAALKDLAAIVETELELRRGIAERALIGAELNHRMKNLFTIVGGMVRLGKRNYDDAADLSADLEGRLNALARAHELIAAVVQQGQAGPIGSAPAQGSEGLQLADLVERLLAPYLGADGAGRAAVAGPAVSLGGRAVTNMTLILHELATNSVKYGALGKPEGRLDLEWASEGDQLRLIWSEESGAPAEAARSSEGGGGFGSQLLGMIVEDQLHGQMTSTATPTGLRHEMTLFAAALAR